MSIRWTLQPQDEAIRLDVSIDFRLSVFSIRRPVWRAFDMRDSLILGGRQAGRWRRMEIGVRARRVRSGVNSYL